MIGRIRKGSDYRVSFQAALWKRDTLKKILKPGENAWEAEKNGTIRSEESEQAFLSVKACDRSEWPIRYLNAIIKRKWTPEAVQAACRAGISLDLSKRPQCNWYDQWRRKKHFRKFVNAIAVFFRFVFGCRVYSRLRSLPLIKKIIY